MLPSPLRSEPGATGTVITYRGWPLYRCSGDSANKQAGDCLGVTTETDGRP
ncbi:MAG: hypothetical protein ACRENX_10950 [Candidatus Dormibacteria bacterium]